MRMTMASYNRLRRRVAKATGRKLPKAPAASGPNLTESAFNRQVLAGVGRFIGDERRNSFTVTRLGSKYTPDFVYAGPKHGPLPARPVLVEVKGKYRSRKDGELIERRSRLAWEIAADENPSWLWAWAKRVRAGEWAVELYDPSEWEAKTVKAVCRNNEDFERMLKGTVKDEN